MQQQLHTYFTIERIGIPLELRDKALRLYIYLISCGGKVTCDYATMMVTIGMNSVGVFLQVKQSLINNGLLVVNGDTWTIAEMPTGNGSSQQPEQADLLAPHIKQLYAKLDKDVPGALSNFIKQHKPDFIEPYVAAWNKWAEKKGNPKVQLVTKHRQQKFKQRIKEKSFDFIALMNAANKSELVQGKNWFSFDWLFFSEKNYTKLLEGNYVSKYKAPGEAEQKEETGFTVQDERMAKIIDSLLLK